MSPSFPTLVLATLSLFLPFVDAHPYQPELVSWNINVNPDPNASVLDFKASRPNQTYTPSPQNWRQLPFYTLLLDKFADGDPRNNDFFGSVFESDVDEVNLRFGGDIRGLQQHLDYLQGMGIRAIYIAGTPFINMLWQADSTRAFLFVPLPFLPPISSRQPTCLHLPLIYPLNRLFSTRFLPPRPPLGHLRRLERCHRRYTRPRNVYYG